MSQTCILSLYSSHVGLAHALIPLGDKLGVHLQPISNVEEAMPQPHNLP